MAAIDVRGAPCKAGEKLLLLLCLSATQCAHRTARDLQLLLLLLLLLCPAGQRLLLKQCVPSISRTHDAALLWRQNGAD